MPNEDEKLRCQSCGTARMFQDRFRCLECVKYDLCGMCFDQRCESQEHRANHAMVHFTGPNEVFGETVMNIDEELTLENFRRKYAHAEQEGIQCKYHPTGPIRGLYFKCDSCRQCYLCFECLEKRVHHDAHTLLAMADQRLLEIPIHDIQLYDEIGRGGFGTSASSKWMIFFLRVPYCRDCPSQQMALKKSHRSMQSDLCSTRQEESGEKFSKRIGRLHGTVRTEYPTNVRLQHRETPVWN